MKKLFGLGFGATLTAFMLSGTQGLPAVAADTAAFDYGATVAVGSGSMRSYTQTSAGALQAVGIEISGGGLRGLPAGGHPSVFSPELPASAAPAGFKFMMVDWNPAGHVPPGVYDLPHFDFHFYYQDRASVAAIAPGECPGKGEGVSCETFDRGMTPVPAELVPPGYVAVGAVVPQMGNHLIGVTGPEFTGKKFTHTWIYGSYDGALTFGEPMITLEYLLSKPDTCVAIPQPQAFEFDGLYPTQYCMRYVAGLDAYRVPVEGFKAHTDRNGLVASSYGSQLCRTADAPGLASWVKSSLTLFQIRNGIAGSAEGARVAAVRSLYQSLLKRDPMPADCGGLRSWVDSGMGLDEIRAGIMNSAEYRGR